MLPLLLQDQTKNDWVICARFVKDIVFYPGVSAFNPMSFYSLQLFSRPNWSYNGAILDRLEAALPESAKTPGRLQQVS